MSCAAIRVPYDYSNPTAGRLNLAVGRATAPGLPADAPPLVVLVNDGPLDATLANVDRLQEIAAALPGDITDHFAVIGIDVRGSGSSAAGVDCFYDYPVDTLFTMNADQTTAAAQSYLNELARVFTFGCQDAVDADMVFFNTAQVADDLDSLRSALGRDTIDLLGIGHGATAAAVYVDRYPGRAGHVVLDGPADSATGPVDRAVTSAEQFERALQTFFADCAAQPDCALGADPTATLQKAIDALDHDPLETSIAVPNSGALLWALVMGLPDRDRWPDLVHAIDAAADGDPNPVADALTDVPRRSARPGRHPPDARLQRHRPADLRRRPGHRDHHAPPGRHRRSAPSWSPSRRCASCGPRPRLRSARCTAPERRRCW